MFFRGNIEHSALLYDIIDDVEDRAHCIRRLKMVEIYVFFNTEGTACIIYEPSFGKIKWMNGHCFSRPKGRGRKLKEMFWSTGIWMFENTDTEVITGIVPPSLRRYGLFLGIIGATRIYEYEGTVMYVYTSEQVPEFKEKLRCLRRHKE